MGDSLRHWYCDAAQRKAMTASDWEREFEEQLAAHRETMQHHTRVIAENASLRDALEVVEWVGERMWLYCPWCHADYQAGEDHKPDCQRQAAIAAVSGDD